MEGTGSLLPLSAAQGPCPPDPYQAVRRSAFDFGESTKTWLKHRSPPALPAGHSVSRQYLHSSFAVLSSGANAVCAASCMEQSTRLTQTDPALGASATGLEPTAPVYTHTFP